MPERNAPPSTASPRPAPAGCPSSVDPAPAIAPELAVDSAPAGCPSHVAERVEVRSRVGRAPLPPGPRGLPLVGVAPQFVGDPFGYLPRLAREYGDVVNVPIPGNQVIALSHPDLVAHAFVRHHDRYRHASDNFAEALQGGGPPSLPLREGQDWKRVRRVMNPKFSEQSLAAISGPIASAIDDELDHWRQWADTGEQFELQGPLGVLAMSALQRSMFSRDPDRTLLVEWGRRAKYHGSHLPVAWATLEVLTRLPGGRAAYDRVPWPHLRRGRENVGWLHRRIEEIIADRRTHPIDEPDLLNLLLEARFDDATGFTDAELRSELMALLFAGFETTAAALAWTLQLLARHPDELANAHAAIDALDGAEIGYHHLPQLTYLRNCFDEAQRIQGAPFAARWATQDDEIGGYFIPKGTMVVAVMSGLHNDPRFWTEPHRFKPQRFTDEKINRNAYLAFGLGARKCIGVRMAYIEAVLALAKILQRYRIEVAPDWQPRHRFHFSIGLKDLPVTLHHRSDDPR